MAKPDGPLENNLGVGSFPTQDSTLPSHSPDNKEGVHRHYPISEETRLEPHGVSEKVSEGGDNDSNGKTPQESANDDSDIANPPDETDVWKRIAIDIGLLLAILFLILWPWVFFGVVQGRKGVQMYGRLADVIDRYPQRVGAVVTFLSTINHFIATILFGRTVVRLGQEVVAAEMAREMTVFEVTALLAFRHMTIVWGIGQWIQLKNGKGRWLIFLLLLATLGAFALVPSGTAGLITPGQFNKTAPLKGTELDFTSTDPRCLAWMEQNRVINNCDWRYVAGTQFTMCLSQTQLLDVLDSGRANMLSALGLTKETSSLNQLGVSGGIRFLGSAKGVLPIGPNGVAILNTLNSTSNPFADENIRKRMVSYNYTLTQQGLESHVSCSYENTSPIEFQPSPTLGPRIMTSNGTCDPAAGLEQVLEGVNEYNVLNTENTLASWACKQTPQPGSQDATYIFYLRGRQFYEETIGNITCRISPLRAQDYTVQYQSSPKYFISQANTNATPPSTTFDRFIDGMIIGLGNIIWESQNWVCNAVAEAVFSMGAKNLGLSTRKKDLTYLRLYEAMIKGMLDYEGTYSRLVYSATSDPPAYCLRNVNGSVTYSVRGWYIENAATQAGLLLPMTLVNVASFCLLIACFIIGKFGYKYKFDATNNVSLLAASVPFKDVETGKDSIQQVSENGARKIKWKDKVKYLQPELPAASPT